MNHGKLSKACSFRFLLAPSASRDKDGPFLWAPGGRLSFEGLMTCFRGEGGSQGVLLAPAVSQTPSASNAGIPHLSCFTGAMFFLQILSAADYYSLSCSVLQPSPQHLRGPPVLNVPRSHILGQCALVPVIWFIVKALDITSISLLFYKCTKWEFLSIFSFSPFSLTNPNS